MNQILLQDEVTPKAYLNALIQAYPYTIDDDTVYSLLNKTTYPHPALIAFLKYFTEIPKYHLIQHKTKDTDNLHDLAERMSSLQQLHESVLHMHQFMYDATVMISRHSFHNPYAHLPLTKIPFLKSVHLHKPLLFKTPDAKAMTIHRSQDFLYRDLSLHAQDFIAVSIRIVDKCGIIFIPRSQLGSAVALSQLYQCVTPQTHVDFMIIFGITAKENEAAYYYDATNSQYIGYIGGDAHMETFPLLITMVQTIYNAICIDKHDLPVNGFMIKLTKHKTTIGIVCNGCETCGIHELSYALEQYCEKHPQYHMEQIFQQSGTLHFLDNDISATGAQTGALIPLKRLDKAFLLAHLHQGIWLNPNGEAMLIHHGVSFDQTAAFHKVHAFFYVNNYDEKTGIRCFANLEEAKRICSEGCYRMHGRPCHAVLGNTAGVDQQKDETLPLLHHFLDMMYINNIAMGEIYTQTDSADNHGNSCGQSVEALFRFLEEENLFQSDTPTLFKTGL